MSLPVTMELKIHNISRVGSSLSYGCKAILPETVYTVEDTKHLRYKFRIFLLRSILLPQILCPRTNVGRGVINKLIFYLCFFAKQI